MDNRRIVRPNILLKNNYCVLLLNSSCTEREVRYISDYLRNDIGAHLERVILVHDRVDRVGGQSEPGINFVIEIDKSKLIENISEYISENVSVVIDCLTTPLANWGFRKHLISRLLDNGLTYVGPDLALFPNKSRVRGEKPTIMVYGYPDTFGLQPITTTIITILRTLGLNPCVVKTTKTGPSHPRVISTAKANSLTDLIRTLTQKNVEDHNLVIDSFIYNSIVVGCLAFGEGITGKPLHTYINDGIIISGDFEEDAIILEGYNTTKPIPQPDLSIMYLSHKSDYKPLDEFMLESMISKVDIFIFSDYPDTISKNRDISRVKKTIRSLYPRKPLIMDIKFIPFLTSNIENKNVLLIVSVHDKTDRNALSNFIRKKYKPKSLKILPFREKNDEYTVINKHISEKKYDSLIIAYNLINIELLKLIPSRIDTGFLYYSIDHEDWRMVNKIAKLIKSLLDITHTQPL